MLQRLFKYVNPLHQLGSLNYSAKLPFLVTSLGAIILEFIAYHFLPSPSDIGFLAIYIFMALIIYFAFRDGIKGGITVTFVTIGYYLYIIYSRNYQGEQFYTGIKTTFMLASIYLLMATIIGGLKQKIDALIETEADGRRRLRAIIEQLLVGVIVSDRWGVIIQVNAKAQEIIGKEIPIGFVLGSKTLIKALPTNNAGNNLPASPFFDMFKAGEPVINKEYLIQRADGSSVHVSISFNKIENEKNKVIAAAWTINDITAQIELEQRKDDFINMASHELKTPLTSLKLFNDFLIRTLVKNGNDSAQKILERIQNQIDKLQKIVDELLDVSKIKTGKLILNNETFNLNDLLQEVIEMYQGLTEPIRLKLFDQVKPVIRADRFRIYQVLTNLIANALKYSPSHQPVVISVSQIDNEIRVSVQDFGMGIEANQHELIFSRLYQVASHKKKGIQGFGMGLYICKEIIERHNGKIWVESDKGQGATFTFSLPVISTISKTANEQ